MTLQTILKHFQIFALGALAVGMIPELAFGARVARFQVSGQNFLSTGTIKSDIDSNCTITMVNTSSTPQLVTVTVKLYATVVAAPVQPDGSPAWTAENAGTCPTPGVPHNYSGAGTNGLHSTVSETFTLAASGTSGADCSGSSDTCSLPNVAEGHDMSFPLLCRGTKTVQNVRCEGEITVENTTSTPGHIIASGTLTTTVESLGGVSLNTDNLGLQSGGTSRTNTAAPTFTPIMIGEGRPF